MNASAPDLSIIVVNYNTPELTTTLIESIHTNTPSVAYEIIVVENGSKPDRRFSPRPEDARLRLLVSGRNLGFARAANWGAKESRARYLLFANSDCRLTAPIIPQMIRYLDEHPGCAACSPRLVNETGEVHSSIRRFPTHTNLFGSRGALVRLRSDYTLEADQMRKNVEAMAATFMLVRRSAFNEVGGFDEQFFMYVEDTDLCKRLHDAGWKLTYLGDLTVEHRWGASTRLHPWRMQYHHHRSLIRYFRKHYPRRGLANLLLAGVLLLHLLVVSIVILVSRKHRFR